MRDLIWAARNCKINDGGRVTTEFIWSVVVKGGGVNFKTCTVRERVKNFHYRVSFTTPFVMMCIEVAAEYCSAVDREKSGDIRVKSRGGNFAGI
ncbi:hypothetical protein CEXT_483451 [Caerostris extrusa]|uniref:Uncharacterized protein n=1 Tax=Caerostris extrusa TaxID=172846 RepID=A0AAV4WGK6_CAEEX|nr:hypothetical protein CEXT_483451 [Caerostris extrusa]